MGTRCTFLPRTSGPRFQLSTFRKNPYGMRISIDRIDRLTPHANIRSRVKTLPMMRPSGRAMQRLFAAIDAEPERQPPVTAGLGARISDFFSSLSPRTLAWSATLGAIVLIAQAAVIGTVLMKNQSATFRTASLSMNEPVSRQLGGAPPPRALVRFAPDARVADITALLDKYQASIIGNANGGIFRLQFGDQAMSKQDLTSLVNKLSSEKIVNLAVPAS